MKSLKQQLSQYISYHQSRTNQFTHYIGIPAIILGTLILLSWISVTIAGRWSISFAWIAIILTLVYYFRLDIKLASLMTIILVILTLICSWIAFPYPTTGTFVVFIILFVGGWILQFIGHTFEKNKPAFFTGLSQALIAPLYLLIEILKILKLGKYFDLDDSEAPPTDSNDVEQS